jgi:two-component system chemotaxis response regulator CheB
MAFGKGSIILLDNDDLNSRSLEKSLSVAGFSLVTCENTAQCRELLESSNFEVLIADVLLTRDGDLDLIQLARQTLPNLRIVILSDFDSSFLEKQVSSKGADLYVRRPVNFDTLIESLTVARDRPSFSGQVNGIELLDFLQFMMLTGKELIVQVSAHGGAYGRIFVSNGSVLHAECGNLLGEEALFKCLSFKGGKFENQTWRSPDQVTITKPGEFLLMEAARRKDEGSTNTNRKRADRHSQEN